jgi:hypothetical protein
VRVAFLLCLTGCAQLFGLEETTFDQQDAPLDAPSVCDGAPACTSSIGRSVCGQVFGTGAQAGVKLRVAAPTGEKCVAGNTEGPCALTVTGSPMATFFDGTLTGQVVGQIDDCGRYVVGDLDSNADDIAIVFTDLNAEPVFNTTARLLTDRPTIAGTDENVDAFAVTIATAAEWATQMNPASPPETTTGYLIKYTLNTEPVVEMKVALDNGSAFPAMDMMSDTSVVPWAGYFTGDAPFGVLENVASEGTTQSGTAFAVLPTGPFSLEGVRTGKRCKLPDLRSVANTLIHILEVGC